MRDFIRKSIVFLLFPAVYFGGNHLYNKHAFQNNAIQIASKSILIIGDSHTQKSLNPTIFGNALNISQKAEPYVMTFWKMEKILSVYHPDTLIIGFSPHNLSAFNDLKFSNPNWSSEMAKRSYTFNRFHTLDGVIPLDYAEYYRETFKQTAICPKSNHVRYIGAYVGNTTSQPTNWKSVTKRHFQPDELDYPISKLSVSCLDSILQLCQANNIHSILVNSPVHYTYRNNIPDTILCEYEAIKRRLQTDGHKVIDMELSYPDSLFYDSDHLNSYGATQFTNSVVEKMRMH